jgi:hypothetical protein
VGEAGVEEESGEKGRGELVRTSSLEGWTLGSGARLPVLFAKAGERASKRVLEFFTAHIRNPHTRRAYGRATARFAGWCEARGLALEALEPVLVAAYVEELQGQVAAPSVKQHLAGIRMLFDYMVTGGVLRFNPAAAVRGPKYKVKVGKTPVLTAGERRALLGSIPGDDPRPAGPGAARGDDVLVPQGRRRRQDDEDARLLPPGRSRQGFRLQGGEGTTLTSRRAQRLGMLLSHLASPTGSRRVVPPVESTSSRPFT